ncbi:mechanosensitive ion channel family protein [Desulfopila aestuarii]|uniref:Small-conductance mechanosensitive channel n=1 Tax=Desulfopila aestuarii DSM 18488 TaxID=1121416 RepID=A0A1M7YCR6_9BACT|nr:mechanosensitive ion channel family protein [Desulfopila aestuarii]SHO50379.1 Small-conductance mechanosensitive channel [Desulfopila aestuarii DSM 18488]
MFRNLTSGFRILPSLLAVVLAAMLCGTDSTAEEITPDKSAPPESTTSKRTDIPIDELELLVKPLTKDELIIEADAWLALLKTKVEEVSAAEIAIKRKNKEIEKAKEVKEEIEKAQETLNDVKEAAETSMTDASGDAAKKAVAAAQKAQQAVDSVATKIDDALATSEEVAEDQTVNKALKATGVKIASEDKPLEAVEALKSAKEAQTATKAVTEAAKETEAAGKQGEQNERTRKAEKTAAAASDAHQALDNTGKAVTSGIDKSTTKMAADIAGADTLEEISAQAATAAKADAEIKTRILEAITDLRAERTALIDRLNVVLDELNTKLGKALDGKDNELVVPYRLYANSVGGIKVDVSDREAALSTITGWIKSDEGGLRWALNIIVFIATILAFLVLGFILGKLAEKAFGIAQSSSILLRNFVVHSVRRVTLIIGLIIGLSALEVDIGPLLAVIGAAGFVVAFALQSTLSNFASGIMIMLYRPFDVGNLVQVAGVMGVVRSMNLVTTTITTADNQIMVVPNNSIWGNIIINITGSELRRIDLVFGIGYSDNIAHAQKVLEELVRDHPLVLEQPEPVIKVHELAESSVNFICRPWAKTGDYWTVYWDLTRLVKERFDAEGISIPFPQRDIHFYQESPQSLLETS